MTDKIEDKAVSEGINIEELPAEERIQSIEAAIEAILYAAGRPVEYSKIGEALGLETRDVKSIIGHMAARISKEIRGITLLTFSDSCQFCTREVFAPYIREALEALENIAKHLPEILAEGEAADRDDLIYLEKLPLFDKDGKALN